MNQKLLRNFISITLAMLISAAFLAGCSKDDEPEYPNGDENSEYGTTLEMLDWSVLPGNWILESYTEMESGNKSTVNAPFTILPFSPKQESKNIVNGDEGQFWAESYDIVSSISEEGIETETSIVGFYKFFGQPLTKSLIYELSFLIHIPDGRTIIYVGSLFNFKDNILTSDYAAIGYTGSQISTKHYSVTFRKL